MDEDYLLQFSILNPPKHVLGRTKQVEEKYNGSIKNGSHKFFLDYLKQRLKTESPMLLENMFPYNTKDNIKHYCIWYSEPFDIEQFLKDLEYLLSSDCCYVVDENYKLPGYFFRESNFKQGIGFSITKIIFIREKSVNPKSKKDGKINVFYQYGLPMFPDVIKLNKSFLQEFYPYKSIRIIVSDPCSKLSLFLWS